MARSPKWPSTKFAELGTYVMPSFSRPDAEQFARGQHFGDVVLDVGVSSTAACAAITASEFTL